MVDPAAGTFGFQPVTAPDSDAKMKNAGPLALPELTTKSEVLLNKLPVGSPPGIVTSNPALANVDPITSPAYTVARSAPLDDTQNPPAVGFTETPQPFFKFVSVIGATPG